MKGKMGWLLICGGAFLVALIAHSEAQTMKETVTTVSSAAQLAGLFIPFTVFWLALMAGGLSAVQLFRR